MGHRAFEEGSRSLIFAFNGLEDSEELVEFGGIIQELGEGDPNGGPFVATVGFWNDLARIYATTGASFRIWYGGFVGHGEVGPTPVSDVHGTND